jgi:hypothetical protein
MFESMTSTGRINLARVRMQKLLEHFLCLLQLNANNQFVVYRPILLKTLSAHSMLSGAAYIKSKSCGCVRCGMPSTIESCLLRIAAGGMFADSFGAHPAVVTPCRKTMTKI